MMMPLWMVVSNNRPKRSATGKISVCGTLLVGSLNGSLTSTLAKLMPRNVIINVVTISFSPYCAFKNAGISDHSAATRMETTQQMMMVSHDGNAVIRSGANAAAATAASRN